MADLLLRDTDRDQLIQDIAAAVVTMLRPLLKQASSHTHERCASRAEMAKILGWSITKLDRRTSEGTIPSLMDEGRRSYVPSEVLNALRDATPAAEAAAKERQAAKQAAKKAK